MLLPGEAGGEPLQHLPVPQTPGQEVVRRPEKERQTQAGPQDSHGTEGRLLFAPTAAGQRRVKRPHSGCVCVCARPAGTPSMFTNGTM